LFTVGGDGSPGGTDPNDGGGTRVDLKEGRIFEMNNQHKHAVSNCSHQHRVHLILDYIDPESVGERKAGEKLELRIELLGGEKLIQTRRSIDR